MTVNKLQIVKQSKDGHDTFHLEGDLTDEAKAGLTSLQTSASKICFFDFSKLRSINSNGVRTWIVFMNDFHKGRDVTFQNCSPVVVNQMNMTQSFAHNARIASVLFPYTCTNCQSRAEMRIDAKDFPNSHQSAKPTLCRSCAAPLPIPEGYFDFTE